MGNQMRDVLDNMHYLERVGLRRYLESLGLKDYQIEIVIDYKLKEGDKE